MRRQTLSMIPALCVALAACGFGWIMTTRTAARATAQTGWRTVSAQGLSFQIPEGSRGPYRRPGSPWSATEYGRSFGGTLRIAQETPQGNLQPALRNWFQLPGPLDRVLTYPVNGQSAQARPVTAFGPSGHFLLRNGKVLQAVLVFDLDGSRYWIQLRTGNPSPESLAGFHRVLLSLRGPEGQPPDPALTRELAAAEAELAPGLVDRHRWPSQLLFLVPVAGILLAAGAQFGVARWSGRAPKESGAWASQYLETPIEVCLGYRFQRRWFDAAVAVLGGRLVLYTFGTPLLTVPLAALAGKVEARTGWFGSPFLELSLQGGQEFHKQRLFYRYLAGNLKLRLYSRDPGRLRAALGA